MKRPATDRENICKLQLNSENPHVEYIFEILKTGKKEISPITNWETDINISLRQYTDGK